MSADRIDQALAHVAQGFAAMSVWSTKPDGTCKCVKGKDCTSPGKHPIPKDGFQAASTDPTTVYTMLSAGSEPNYGIVWPEGSDRVLLILDVDGAEWRQRIAELKADLGPLPATKTTRTPSGGLHLFYWWPKDVPVPEGNTLLGFVVRWPWKGYVVGPGSAINGKTYTDAGIAEIAELPVAWALTTRLAAAKEPLITVAGSSPGYTLPESVPTGHRHDEITRFVASLWNRNITRDAIIGLVDLQLRPLFTEPASDEKVLHDIDEAMRTADRKWTRPEALNIQQPAPEATVGREIVEVGLLDPNAPVAPDPMRSEAFATSGQVLSLINHWTNRTDAGYEGLLVTSLVYLGALMGHTPSCFYGSREQHTNIMAMLVGTTGRSRKGTTVDLVRSALAQTTDGVRGLKQSPNSGEGLIALAAKADGAPILVEEEEFDRFIKAKGRDNSTLSAILRQAFDDVPLSSATAQKIVRADVHHVAMLGNVTREEIVGSMAQVDLQNGFANRIAWIGAFPRAISVSIHDNALPAGLRDDIRAAIAFATGLKRPLIGGTTHLIDDPARDLLADAAARYSVGVGMAPFLSRRLDTIAARIALIYAVLDHERVISTLHVEAALAITDYAWASARWVFPETTGDARADLVLRHLREAGFLNMTAIEALVGKRALDKQQVADLLGLMGYARKATRPRADGKPGRPQQGLEII